MTEERGMEMSCDRGERHGDVWGCKNKMPWSHMDAGARKHNNPSHVLQLV